MSAAWSFDHEVLSIVLLSCRSEQAVMPGKLCPQRAYYAGRDGPHTPGRKQDYEGEESLLWFGNDLSPRGSWLEAWSQTLLRDGRSLRGGVQWKVSRS